MGDDLTISIISGNPNRQLRSASHVFVHPEFNLQTLDHNVAVIRTTLPYTESATFRPVDRPADSPIVNMQCSVAGWGSIFWVALAINFSFTFYEFMFSHRMVRFHFNCHVSMQ